MKPPYCALCQSDCRFEYLQTGRGARLVEFADFDRQAEPVVGHPHGLEWFCDEHAGAAEALADRPFPEAMAGLRARFGDFERLGSRPPRYPSLWITSVGPNVGEVLRILRTARPLTPAEARDLLKAGKFRFDQDGRWPSEGCLLALLAAGASAEIRYL